ncbi:AraC family transcriptional regulator [Fibrisoma montanum]|uniref:AraC family transcriptional regulator n=1 Tax=Fibrisoma montanum TaxID=2305895 RepID=A0A418MIX5_9BACT|nr:AraC family transcriptional regulator [Fibrisoma montanum]RIV27281.1 AraC family transcriptional regulator [Fibrisoma montanum]
MKRYIQHEPFNIYIFSESEWPHPVHNHSYFEIIFIRSGRGQHFINGNTFPYEAGDVFLLGPEDYHYFDIAELTHFCYIRFTELFMKDPSVSASSRWLRTLEFLHNTPYQSTGSLITDPAEKDLLDHLLIVLLHEYQPGNAYDEAIINGLMKAILSILARNIVRKQMTDIQDTKRAKLIEDILLYICQHIHEPDTLRLERLAERFNLSANYISAYFRGQTGESLQQYILKYKLKMIENRLRFSDKSISEISYDFGFTDSSHLNKLFKKYYGLAPLAYRKK